MNSHIPALDGVRGMAILLVLLFHFSQYGHGLPLPSALVDKIFYKILQTGWVGVDLFFVLSGFLITGILYDSKSGLRYFRNFYARRCLRIFPLYYASVAFVLICLPRLLPSSDGFQYLSQSAFWYWTYLSNLLIAQNGWYWFGIIDHFWSLAVEEQFYLVWPVVVLMFDRRRLLHVCLICIVAALVVRLGLVLSGYQTAAYVLTPARMDALAVGGLIALIARGPSGLTELARFVWPTAALTALALAVIFAWRHGLQPSDAIVGTIGHTLLACFFGSTLVIALVSEPETSLGRWLATPGFVFFGRHSYALYVWHHPLLFINPSFLAVAGIPEIAGSQLPARLLYIIVATSVSVALALISWHLCEKQFLRLKRFFPYQVGDGETASATPHRPLSSVTQG